MKVLKIKNLPFPTKEMIDAIYSDIQDSKQFGNFERFSYKFNQVYEGCQENICTGLPIKQPKNLQKFGISLWQNYFSVPIEFGISYFSPKNEKEHYYNIPPHSHTVRTLAINFYIDLGGSQARTYFYNRVNNTGDPIEKYGNWYLREDVKPLSYFVADYNNWYVFPTWMPHSVENINSTRILLTIETPPLYDMVDLVYESKLEFDEVKLVQV